MGKVEIRTCIVCGRRLPLGLPRGTEICSTACNRLRVRPEVCRRLGVIVETLRTMPREIAVDREEHGWLADAEWEPGDCPRLHDDHRPCIHVGCRYHLHGEVSAAGSLRITASWQAALESDEPLDDCGLETCVLDARSDDDRSLDRIGSVFGITRERVRQIEEHALARLRAGLLVAGWEEP